MSISLSVTLLSGRGRVITLSPDSTVEDLRLQAQLSLKVGLERLVTESGGTCPNLPKCQTWSNIVKDSSNLEAFRQQR